MDHNGPGPLKVLEQHAAVARVLGVEHVEGALPAVDVVVTE